VRSELVPIGRVGKPHGLDGSFVVEGASEEPSRFAVGAVLFVAGERAEVVASRRARGRPVIRLDRRVERGAELAVERSALEPTSDGEYYVFELVGMEVEEEGSGRALGRVASVDPYEANDVLALDSGLHLPMVEECVVRVDRDARRILIAPGFVMD
jgi:16S rRNA processing protein RimM